MARRTSTSSSSSSEPLATGGRGEEERRAERPATVTQGKDAEVSWGGVVRWLRREGGPLAWLLQVLVVVVILVVVDESAGQGGDVGQPGQQAGGGSH